MNTKSLKLQSIFGILAIILVNSSPAFALNNRSVQRSSQAQRMIRPRMSSSSDVNGYEVTALNVKFQYEDYAAKLDLWKQRVAMQKYREEQKSFLALLAQRRAAQMQWEREQDRIAREEERLARINKDEQKMEQAEVRAQIKIEDSLLTSKKSSTLVSARPQTTVAAPSTQVATASTAPVVVKIEKIATQTPAPQRDKTFWASIRNSLW